MKANPVFLVFGAGLDALDELEAVADLLAMVIGGLEFVGVGVEVFVGEDLFNFAGALAADEGGGDVEQLGSALAEVDEVQDMLVGEGVDLQGVAEVGVKIGEAGGVDKEVQALRDLFGLRLAKAQMGFAQVTVDNGDLVVQKVLVAAPHGLADRVQGLAAGDGGLEALFGGHVGATSDQEVELVEVGVEAQQHADDDFAEEARGAGDHDLASREGLGDGEEVVAIDGARISGGAVRRAVGELRHDFLPQERVIGTAK